MFFTLLFEIILSVASAGSIFLYDFKRPQPQKGCLCDNNYIVYVAEKEIGVKEDYGNNSGKRVNEYIMAGKGKPGDKWCGHFLVWVWYISECKMLAGNAWAASWTAPKKYQIHHDDVLPGDVGGIYSVKLQRIAHVFLVKRIDGNRVITIEGNTNMYGSREGQGVYSLVRHKKSVSQFARRWCKY